MIDDFIVIITLDFFIASCQSFKQNWPLEIKLGMLV